MLRAFTAAPLARRPARCRRPGDARADAARARATVVAVVSTLVCYIEPPVGIAHPWIFFALDSIINDLCLAILVLTASGR